MELPLLNELLTIFALSIVVIFICYRIKVPAIVGFLITGVISGPYGLGLVRAVHEVEILSEIGIVLLLFTIGMELHLDMLVRLKKFVLLGGTTQVGLTIVVVAMVLHLFGVNLTHGVFAGFLISLSSTAIVLQFFQQRSQMDSPQGHICLAIMVLQDLITVPMVLVIPVLAGAAETDLSASTFFSVAWKLAVIVGGFIAARKIIPLILRNVVRTRSRELFNITVLAICISIALLTESLGLSLSLGAFMAGILLAESEYSQNAMEGVMPFKDIFTSLFFISVGMLLNLKFAFVNIWAVLLLAGMILLIKTIITIGVTRLLHYPWRVAIIVGIAISQVGEFSFVLAKAGLMEKLISNDQYQIFLASSVLTMALAPFLLVAGPHIAKKASALISSAGAGGDEDEDEDENRESGLRDHLIIIGFGISGQHMARAARAAGISYIILEMNPDTVRKYAAKGEPIRYGDATHPATLRTLNTSRARVMSVVISDPSATRGIIAAARQANLGLHIIARTQFLGEVPILKRLGANDVIPEEFETSIEMFTRVLYRYLVPQAEIEHFVEEVRAENYEMLRKRETRKASLTALDEHLSGMDASSLIVSEKSDLVGKTLASVNLRQTLDLTVVAITREGELIPSPGGDFVFNAGDKAYVFGPVDKLIDAGPVFEGN